MSPSRPRPRDPRALLPLKPIELLVLTMLSAGERHGYGLRQDIVEHTEGRVALEAGNPVPPYPQAAERRARGRNRAAPRRSR